MKELLKGESLEAILKANDRVLIDFNADWCGPCRLLKPILQKLEESTKDVLFLSINVDQHEDLAKSFGVSGIPFLVMYKDGEEVGRSVGFQTHAQIMELLKK